MSDSLFARVLNRLAEAVLRYRRWLLLPQVVLFGVCIVYTAGYLKMDPTRSNLVGANKKYHQNFLRFKGEFPIQDDLVVVVESEDTEKNRQFVERLGVKLEAETNMFRNVFYKGNLRMLGRKALLFVPETELAELRKQLHDYQPFIAQFTQATNLVSLFDLINKQFRTAPRTQTAETGSLIKALPVLERILNQAIDSLRRSGTPPSPGVAALFGAGDKAEQQQYITFAGGQLYLVTAHAPNEKLNNQAVERLRQIVDATKIEVPGLNVGLTGEPVLEHDEMLQSKRDSTVATIVSLILCALIFIYGYQETGRPLKATLCLIIGLGYTLGFTTLTVGHLNILTVTFLPILIGLAIDLGVHLTTRYEEELRHGRTEEEALKKAMVFTGQGILTGAFTTAGAFLAMGLTDFKGIQEMGLISGGGLLICLIPMMTMLPVLLLRGRQNVIDHTLGAALERRERIEQLWLRRPGAVVLITAACCALAFTQFKHIFFDYNLLNMQSEGLPAVEYEKKLIEAPSRRSAESDEKVKSVLFAAVIAGSLPKAVELEKRIKELPAVSSVDSMSQYLTEDQARKLHLIGEIKEQVAAIQFADLDMSPVKVEDLSRTLWSFQGYLGAAANEVEREDEALHRQFVSLRDTCAALRRRMLATPSDVNPQAKTRLAAFQQAFFRDIRDTFHALQTQDNRAPLRVEDLPAALRDRFIGVSGKYLLQVYPKKDIWQRENQKEFIDQLRGIDPNVTGTPVQLYEYTTLLKESYEQAAWYALGAIALMVLIHFRSIVSVVLALIPVLIGSIWLGGFMGWQGIPFNPANIMILPLVIGIGVTNGIHILNRFAEEHSPSILAKSTGKAVLVSGLTTIAGFGSLIIAQHQGIESLGYVMAFGVASCMIAGLTFLPALLNLMNRRKML